MKHITASIFFSASLFSSFAQTKNNISTYYDKNWKPTQNRTIALYYRTKPVLKNGLFYINDFYKNGAKQWDGTAFDIKGDIKEGKCTWYNKDGTISNFSIYEHKFLKESVTYGQSNHINNTATYENNLLKKSVTYGASNNIITIIKSTDGKNPTSKETFYANGQLKEKIEFKPEIIYTTYYNNKGEKIGENTNEDKNIIGDYIAFNTEYGDGESVIGKIVYNKKYIEILRQVISSGDGKIYQETIRNGDTGDIITETNYPNGK